MGTEDNVSCKFCGSADAFVVSDFSLGGEKRGHCKSCGAGWAAS